MEGKLLDKFPIGQQNGQTNLFQLKRKPFHRVATERRKLKRTTLVVHEDKDKDETTRPGVNCAGFCSPQAKTV